MIDVAWYLIMVTVAVVVAVTAIVACYRAGYSKRVNRTALALIIGHGKQAIAAIGSSSLTGFGDSYGFRQDVAIRIRELQQQAMEQAKIEAEVEAVMRGGE